MLVPRTWQSYFFKFWILTLEFNLFLTFSPASFAGALNELSELEMLKVLDRCKHSFGGNAAVDRIVAATPGLHIRGQETYDNPFAITVRSKSAIEKAQAERLLDASRAEHFGFGTHLERKVNDVINVLVKLPDNIPPKLSDFSAILGERELSHLYFHPEDVIVVAKLLQSAIFKSKSSTLKLTDLLPMLTEILDLSEKKAVDGPELIFELSKIHTFDVGQNSSFERLDTLDRMVFFGNYFLARELMRLSPRFKTAFSSLDSSEFAEMHKLVARFTLLADSIIEQSQNSANQAHDTLNKELSDFLDKYIVNSKAETATRLPDEAVRSFVSHTAVSMLVELIQDKNDPELVPRLAFASKLQIQGFSNLLQTRLLEIVASQSSVYPLEANTIELFFSNLFEIIPGTSWIELERSIYSPTLEQAFRPMISNNLLRLIESSIALLSKVAESTRRGMKERFLIMTTLADLRQQYDLEALPAVLTILSATAPHSPVNDQILSLYQLAIQHSTDRLVLAGKSKVEALSEVYQSQKQLLESHAQYADFQSLLATILDRNPLNAVTGSKGLRERERLAPETAARVFLYSLDMSSGEFLKNSDGLLRFQETSDLLEMHIRRLSHTEFSALLAKTILENRELVQTYLKAIVKHDPAVLAPEIIDQISAKALELNYRPEQFRSVALSYAKLIEQTGLKNPTHNYLKNLFSQQIVPNKDAASSDFRTYLHLVLFPPNSRVLVASNTKSTEKVDSSKRVSQESAGPKVAKTKTRASSQVESRPSLPRYDSSKTSGQIEAVEVAVKLKPAKKSALSFKEILRKAMTSIHLTPEERGLLFDSAESIALKDLLEWSVNQTVSDTSETTEDTPANEDLLRNLIVYRFSEILSSGDQNVRDLIPFAFEHSSIGELKSLRLANDQLGVLMRTRNSDIALKRTPLVLVFDSSLEKNIERMKAVLVAITNGLFPHRESTEEYSLFVTDIFEKAMFKDELQFTAIHFLSEAYSNRWISKADFDRIMTEVICVSIGRKYDARTIDKFVAIQNLWDKSSLASLGLNVSRYLSIAPEKLSSILRTKESLRNIINSVREAAARTALIASKQLLGKTVARAVVPYIAAARGLLIKNIATPTDSVSHDFVMVDPRNGKEISVFLRVVYATAKKSNLNVSAEQISHIGQKDKPIIISIELSNLADFNPVGYFLTNAEDLILYEKNDGSGVEADLREMTRNGHTEFFSL